MKQTIEAIYENGLLRPLAPLNLTEHERVTLTVQNGDIEDWLDHDAIAMAKHESAGAPSLEQVRKELSEVPGSWADDIIADRGEY
jgi:predicted DNA-binding antitoxin AbrB/MazE fold protein